VRQHTTISDGMGLSMDGSELCLDDIFAALRRSPFRRRQQLGPRARAYLEAKGMETVLAHAADFVAQRLAPAEPKNDGKQTPMRGHPVLWRSTPPPPAAAAVWQSGMVSSGAASLPERSRPTYLR
jgi:hypothetical protein